MSRRTSGRSSSRGGTSARTTCETTARRSGRTMTTSVRYRVNSSASGSLVRLPRLSYLVDASNAGRHNCGKGVGGRFAASFASAPTGRHGATRMRTGPPRAGSRGCGTSGLSPPFPWVFLARPSSVALPSGPRRGGCRLQAVAVHEDGLDESDDRCPNRGLRFPSVWLQLGRRSAAEVLPSEVPLEGWVVHARPSRVRMSGIDRIRWHHVPFRSRARLFDVHGGSRDPRAYEPSLGVT